MKRIIGLTGNSGAGKSTAAAYMECLGAEVIDADQISRELCDMGQAGYTAIKKEFGEGFFCKDGSLDRHKLGALVFADCTALERLNHTLHPLVLREVRRRKAASQKDVIVIDCALLLDTELNKDVDEVWLICAPNAQKQKRIRQRDGISEQNAENRLKSQTAEMDMIKQADVVLENNGTLEQLKEQIREHFYGKSQL